MLYGFYFGYVEFLEVLYSQTTDFFFFMISSFELKFRASKCVILGSLSKVLF